MSAPFNTTEPERENLARLRVEIESVDRDVIRLIARRIALARQVGAVKRAAGLPTLDPEREAAVVRRAGKVAREEGVPDEDVRYLFWHIIGMSRRAQLIEE